MNDTLKVEVRKLVQCKFGVTLFPGKVYKAKACGVPNRIMVEHSSGAFVMLEQKKVKFVP